MPNQLARGHPAGARLLSIAILGLLVAACGPAATATPAAPTAVEVTLQEWSITPSVATVKAGSVTFTAKNSGPTDQHEMVVIKTELGLLDLPTGADGKVDEEGAGVEAIGEIEEIAVGATGTVTLNLAAGRYLLICNVVDADGDAHYGKGMTTEFTVN
jgi:uncharacterized cupredoxin-like copper-binding protein